LRDDPATLLGPTDELQIVPPGPRPSYCLLQAVAMTDGGQATVASGVDYCATEVGPHLAAARDSGIPSYLALPVDDGVQLVVQAPIYSGGDDPGSPAVRRARYLGSLGTSISPEVLFANVLHEQDDMTITLTYEDEGSVATFSSGTIDGDTQSVRQDFGNGWNVAVTRADPHASWWDSETAIRLLIAGVSASLVFGTLLFVLGTSRRRALRLVERRTDQLNHQALHDSLTGLPNRTLILDRAEQLLARCRRNGTTGAALYLDLDGFKDVNDSLGHEAGDQLLRSVAARLTTSLRGVDTIGRLGGDEFVVLVDEGTLHTGPELVAERLIEVLRQPFDLDLAPRPIVISTSVGIASGDRATAGDLLRDADIALYQAKEAGRDRYEVFRPDMETAVQRQFELEADLRDALDADQFELYYQPIYDLTDLSVIGAEALIRWHHPTRGTIPPGDFIPRLEVTGQIIDVGRWVLHEACRQARQWQDAGNDLIVSINVSARQLEDAIVQHVADALAESGTDPHRITLEITETVLMHDTELTIRTLTALKELGVTLAIDDFGTGYSSLAYLQQFPVDCLKIDRSFTDAIARTTESDALIHTLVQLGRTLGLTTLAEGVETTGQLDYLRSVDVDEAQGFLLARPLTASDFSERMFPHNVTPTRKP
ncbi:MAG: putative bifunctional diguanylate cyclase/phosphodiesterase, partial [Ilumatobacteraceae bacterium]